MARAAAGILGENVLLPLSDSRSVAYNVTNYRNFGGGLMLGWTIARAGATLLVTLALALLLAGTEFTDVGTASSPDAIHYPDLRTTTPSGLNIQDSGGQKLLRFNNTIWNAGDGRMELRPQNNQGSGTTDAYQRLYSHNSGGSWYLASETLVGTFVFHQAHNHWHFEDFAHYELHDVAPDGSIGTTVLATNDKVSFCLIDSGVIDSGLEHYGPATYSLCEQNAMQGISVGWGDTYSWTLPGQSLDITGLPNGSYWLISTSDPSDRLAETHNGNNMGIAKVSIDNNNAQVISTDGDSDAIPDEIDNCPAADNAGQENAVHPATPAGDHCEDPDADLVVDASDNCADAANAGQEKADGDGLGDACDSGDSDSDALTDSLEYYCGSSAASASSLPERTDGAFAGTDDDGDGPADEPLPASSSAFDCDRDGWTGSEEASIFATPGAANDQDPCGNNGWPADVESSNALGIGDFNSFTFPLRADGSYAKFGHPVPDPEDTAIARWDLSPGAAIDVGDINAINPSVMASTSRPPMLGGQPAFGLTCPWAP